MANKTPVYSGYISSTYVRLLFEYLEQQGVDAVHLLGKPPPDASDSGLTRYAMEQWASYLRTASDYLNDDLLGIHVGRLITPAHIGVLGYVIQACSSLGEALLRLERFLRLVYDAEPMQIRERGADLELVWGLEWGRPGQLVDSMALAALVKFIRDLAGDAWRPAYLSFINPVPSDPGAYETYFGCAITYHQQETIVAFNKADLVIKPAQPDATLLSILEDQAEQLLARLPPSHELERKVRRALMRQIRNGVPRLSDVAGALGMSPRKLQRLLEAESMSFQVLLEDCRRILAEQYLADPRLQLSEIAFLVGYSEQSAFSRAFKYWTGVSPGAWRKRKLT